MHLKTARYFLYAVLAGLLSVTTPFFALLSLAGMFRLFTDYKEVATSLPTWFTAGFTNVIMLLTLGIGPFAGNYLFLTLMSVCMARFKNELGININMRALLSIMGVVLYFVFLQDVIDIRMSPD